MTIKPKRRSKIGLGVATFAAVAATLPIAGIVEAALPPINTPATDVAIISPSTVKTSGTSFQLDLPPTARVVTGNIVTGSATVTSAAAAFTAADVGRNISGTGIPASTRITAFNSTTSVTISANATATNATASLSIVGGNCPGDGTVGNRWTTFIVPAATDSSQLTFANITGTPVGAAAGFTAALRSPGGTIITGQTSLGIGDGQIALPAGGVSLSLQAIAVPAGNYKVGIACTLNTGGIIENTRYWETTTTVAAATGAGPQNFIWGNPAPATVPTITATAPSASVPVVSYTVPAAISGVTNLTATVTPTNPAGAALAPINVPITQAFPNSTGTFPVPGLTLGTEYSVTVTATSTVGTTAASSSVTVQQINSPVTPGPAATGVDGTDTVTINWAAPGTGPAPSGYRVNISGQAAQTFGPAVFTTGAVSLPNATYTATVTALYPASAFVPGNASAPSNTVTVASKPNTLLYQVITVERPAGALILTQRCGVYGGLPAFGVLPGVTTNAPGVSFPESLAAVGTVGTTVVPATGTAPILPNGSTGLLPAVANGGVDPQIGQYPNPATPQYPTQCGVAMGTARLVLEGPMAGSFYTADGRMNQVTVLDTRDDDKGWVASGNIPADFATGPVGAPTDTFSGNFLGWQPIRTRMTTRPDYLRAGVTAGSLVVPGAGSPGTAGPGLKNNPVLAQAPATEGLGIVDLDARLALLIPATADRGVYTGRLDLTVVSR